MSSRLRDSLLVPIYTPGGGGGVCRETLNGMCLA